MSEIIPESSIKPALLKPSVLGALGESALDLSATAAVQQANTQALSRVRPPLIVTQVNRMQDGRVLAGVYPNTAKQPVIEADILTK